MIKTGKAGSGTYGIVYNAKTPDKDGNVTYVAVKRNFVDSSISFSGSIKELDLLNRLRGHPYIVKLLSISFGNPFTTPNSPLSDRNKGCKEDYLHFVFEKAEKNLHELIYSRSVHISYIKLAMVQLLLGIEYMHAKNVIHRDIKPSNLLWFTNDNKTMLKICDFGLAKIKTQQEPSTPKVVTCWYRAPEICIRDENYSYSSDMWSVGLVLYEMISRKALLMGVKDNDNRILNKILEYMPRLTENDKERYSDYYRSKVSRSDWKKKIKLSGKEIKEFNKYPGNGANYNQYLDLIDKLIIINPDERLTATQALSHPFFEPYQEFIQWCRDNYSPVCKEEPKIYIIDCIERRWATKIAFVVFNGRSGLEWYKHRIIFQSIDLFDRYLFYLENQDLPGIFLVGKAQNQIKETKYSGKYMTRYETQLRYVVCLYICIKYFTTLSIPISFEDLATEEYKTYKALIEAEEFEQKILKDVVEFKMYRETIYEAADRLDINLDEYKTRDLLLAYGTCETKKDITPSELLEILL